MLRIASASLCLATVAVVSLTASAQCLGPDNLDSGACCAPVGATLPIFPTLTLPGLGICWDNCVPNPTACATVVIGAPQPAGCAQFTASVDVQDCNGQLLLQSQLVLDYTRTWDEFQIPGQIAQVFRFVVKGDFTTTAAGGPSCQVPSCLAVHPTAFFYGYLDYSFDCSGVWSAAIVLYHGCDNYQHTPGLSSRPGAFHPQRSFAVVAPSTPGNPFIPVVLPAPGGPAVAEAIRQAWTPSSLTCTAEEPILGGVVQPLASACVCPFSLFPAQTTARHVDVTGVCGSFARSVNAFPAVPWFENLSISLGAWTTTASYPGPEEVWVDEGAYVHLDACDPSGLAILYAEIKYGATTASGFPAIQASGLPLDKFTDLASNYSSAVSTAGIVPPFFGHVIQTRNLVYTNAP